MATRTPSYCRPKRRTTWQERNSRGLKRREREARKRNGDDFTPEQKRARKIAHADYLRRALAELESPEGMRRFLIAREVNPHLTPLAVAAVAMDGTLGVVYRPAHGWKAEGRRVSRGESARVFGTKAPNFNPLPLFGEDQLVGGEHYDRDDVLEAIGDPAPSLLEAGCELFARVLERGLSPAKTLGALIAEGGI